MCEVHWVVVAMHKCNTGMLLGMLACPLLFTAHVHLHSLRPAPCQSHNAAAR